MMSGLASSLRLALVLVTAVLVGLLVPAAASLADDEDVASTGEWIYASSVFVGAVALLIVVRVASRGRVNPHTGLPSRMKRRQTPRPGRGATRPSRRRPPA